MDELVWQIQTLKREIADAQKSENECKNSFTGLQRSLSVSLLVRANCLVAPLVCASATSSTMLSIETYASDIERRSIQPQSPRFQRLGMLYMGGNR